MFADGGFVDPAVTFDKGVAMIDAMTLVRAAEALAHLGYDLTLPTAANLGLPPVFADLCKVAVTPGPAVTTTIDTQKMRWDYEASSEVWRDDFRDYAGVERYGVHLKDCPVAQLDGATVTRACTKLRDGRQLWLWFAGVPFGVLSSMGLYELFVLAGSLAKRFDESDPEEFDWVVVPAQQIAYARGMHELLPANPLIQTVEQRLYMALDETGVRVKVMTMIETGSMPMLDAEVHSYVFGSRNPVVMWLTEPWSSAPFAVVATTSDAWLDIDEKVSFEDSEFEPGV